MNIYKFSHKTAVKYEDWQYLNIVKYVILWDFFLYVS